MPHRSSLLPFLPIISTHVLVSHILKTKQTSLNITGLPCCTLPSSATRFPESIGCAHLCRSSPSSAHFSPASVLTVILMLHSPSGQSQRAILRLIFPGCTEQHLKQNVPAVALPQPLRVQLSLLPWAAAPLPAPWTVGRAACSSHQSPLCAALTTPQLPSAP